MSVTETDQTVADTEKDGEDESGSTEEDLSRDDIFHFLQCRRRRLVLKYLQEYTGDSPAIMSDITEHIAALENDTSVRSLTSQQRQRVYIALYQSHLPKMDRAGIVDYNQNRGYVEHTNITADFHPYLNGEPSVLPDSEVQAESEVQASPTEQGSPWPRQRLVTAVLSVIVATVIGLSGFALGLVSGTGLALMATALLGTLTAVHAYSQSAGD